MARGTAAVVDAVGSGKPGSGAEFEGAGGGREEGWIIRNEIGFVGGMGSLICTGDFYWLCVVVQVRV